MKLTEMKVTDYLNLLKSEAPAPGGGSASALSGAQGMALTLMVANLTLSKEKYETWHEGCSDTLLKGTALYEDLVDLVDLDTQAYNRVSEAYRLPKESEEEKACRSSAIAAANLEATEIPFCVMKAALEGLRWTKGLVGQSNPNAASDLGVAAACLETAVKGAWLNVCINLPGVKDLEKKGNFENLGRQYYEESMALTTDVIRMVQASL